MNSPNDDAVDESEAALLARVREGDPQAFTALVTQYLDTVTRFAVYLLDSQDAAEDVAQNVFVSLWERRATLGEVRSLKSYLFRTVRNRAFNERKANLIRERYRVAMQAEDSLGALHGSAVSSEDSMLTTVAVQAAMDQLPERRRLALRLRIEDQLSYAEIGEILGVSPDAARVLATRAALELRKKLGVFA